MCVCIKQILPIPWPLFLDISFSAVLIYPTSARHFHKDTLFALSTTAMSPKLPFYVVLLCDQSFLVLQFIHSASTLTIFCSQWNLQFIDPITISLTYLLDISTSFHREFTQLKLHG